MTYLAIVLGPINSAKPEICLVKWTFYPIIKQLVIPKTFAPLPHQCTDLATFIIVAHQSSQLSRKHQ